MHVEETLMKLNMSFLIKDDELLGKYNKIWEKVKNSIDKEFNSKPVYNVKYLKAKIKSYNGKINANFHNNKMSREGSEFIYLSVIFINSVFRTGKYYFPQVLLEERKYVVKEKKIPKYIIDVIEVSSDSDRENFNEENFDEENSDKETSGEKVLVKKLPMKKIKNKKTDKIFLKFFSIYIKMTNNYYKKKTKKSFKKKHVKGNKILLKKKKTKSTNMLMSNIEIFLKKEKKRSVNMVENNIRIF